jgi:hypothetical protein
LLEARIAGIAQRLCSYIPFVIVAHDLCLE